MDVCVFDIETDGLDPTKVHVLSVLDGKGLRSTDSYNNIRSWASKAKVLVAHNCIRYDLPILKRLVGCEFSKDVVVIDTLALSWYLFPDRAKHGLGSWGDELGVAKPVVDDWEGLDFIIYRDRCEEDVKINKLLWDLCWDRLLLLYGSEEEALRLCAYLTFKMTCAADQERLKWRLDVERCSNGVVELNTTISMKREELARSMPKVVKHKVVRKPDKMYKINGQLSQAGSKWLELSGGDDSLQELEVVASVSEPNPGSVSQIKDWLYSLGWVPETFEYKRDKDTGDVKKIPQVVVKGEGVCPSVVKLFDKEPALSALDGLSIANHRLGVLEGLLSNVNDDGYIVASVAGLTNTLRFKHSVLVNLPGVDKPYGELIRGCLIAPDGYELCGSDMSSLEDRTKQHYMWSYDEGYVREMLGEGYDPHLALAQFAGEVTEEEVASYALGEGGKEFLSRVKAIRKVYKAVNYACVYGAGGATVARSAGVSTERGEELVKAYWDKNWSVKSIAADQKVKIIDNQRWLFNPVSRLWYSLRAEKDIFSTLNQGTGVWCFDTWVKHVKARGLDVIGQFHDEVVCLVKKESRELTLTQLKSAMADCNKELCLNRELDCEVQFGSSYADIH